MRKLLTLGLLIASVSGTRVLPAQRSATSVKTVRLRYERVDQVALDFGVDTAAMREQAIRRLSDAGIAVATDPRAPELRITVRVPKSLAPVDVGILSVDMALIASDRADTHRTIWYSSGTTVRFTTYTSLPRLAPEQLARGLDELAAAHRGT
jgi:hypothetical protein